VFQKKIPTFKGYLNNNRCARLLLMSHIFKLYPFITDQLAF